MNLNSFPIEQIQEDHYHPRHFALSSSLSCRNFSNPTQDHADYYHHQDTYYSYQGGSTSYGIKNKDETSEFKLTLWKKEVDDDPMKLMPSKMKNYRDRVSIKIKTKVEDHKIESISSSFGSDNSSSNNNNSPVRVCSDCNTTKTPLWRSGPKGPKSLCNACGIRQRKARRAMAAENGTTIASNQPPIKKINVLVKEKQILKNRNTLPLKKRFKPVVGSQSNLRNNKLALEDFLIKLSKSLTFHGVFPEDEKDAAILLMALSSGLVHG